MKPTVKKPPEKARGCEYCLHRGGDFSIDKTDPEREVIRVYCKARYTMVDCELMTRYCDFVELNPSYKPEPQKSDGI